MYLLDEKHTKINSVTKNVEFWSKRGRHRKQLHTTLCLYDIDT